MDIATLIRNAIWKSVGLMPLSRRLQVRASLIEYGWSQFENEWCYLSRLGPNRGLAIDIGANRGFYSLKLAELYERVIAFEPNLEISVELAALNNRKIELHSKALSSERGIGVLHIPRTNREELDGWASFEPVPCPDIVGRRSFNVQKHRLDDFMLRNVGFIKIDVEGHELEVLKGSLDTLANSDPGILIEIRSANQRPIFDLLESQGYARIDHASKLDGPPSVGLFLFERDGSEMHSRA